MKLSRLIMIASLLGLLSLNGCMLGHLFSGDDSGMHGGMGMHDGMGMMHSSDGEDDDTSSEDSSYE